MFDKEILSNIAKDIAAELSDEIYLSYTKKRFLTEEEGDDLKQSIYSETRDKILLAFEGFASK